MKNLLTSLLFCCSCMLFSQENLQDATFVKIDTIVYQKSTEINTERVFTNNINKKYTGKEFEYTEEVEEKTTSNFDTGLLQFFVTFMSNVFPYLLGGFVIFIIVRAILGNDLKFWKSQKGSKKLSEKLIYEDEDINELNLGELLKNAIQKNDYRLAIRYYYLTSLKKLSKEKIIEYHKDKTNSEYLFEIKNDAIKQQFTYLSYVYSYVWYGEFSVDENKFKSVENKYQSFLKTSF